MESRYSASIEVDTDSHVFAPFQREIAHCAIDRRRGIISVPMGAGKTRIGILIAKLGLDLGVGRWIMIVASKEMKAQALKEFEGCELDHLLGDGVNVATWRECQDECMYAQCYDYGCIAGVIVDECHGLPAQQRCEAYMRLAVHAEYRIGLSGTPLDRRDGKNGITIALLGPIIWEATLADMEAIGRIASGHVAWI